MATARLLTEDGSVLTQENGGALLVPVLVSLAVTPQGATVYDTQTLQFTATATYDDGSTATLPATWSVDNGALASVSASGLYANIADGPVVLTATLGAFSATSAVTNAPAPASARMSQAGVELVTMLTDQRARLSQVGVEVVVPLFAAHARMSQMGVEIAIPRVFTITITPPNAITYLAASVQFHAAKTDQFGNPYPLRVAWSCDAAIGTIDAFGKFTASATGSTDVTATEVV